MSETSAEGLRDLRIEDGADTISPNRCLFLEMLPAELRVEIYELALRQDPAFIIINLKLVPVRNDTRVLSETDYTSPEIPTTHHKTMQPIHTR